MDKIKTVKIKNPDGSVSEETYTISVDAKDVDMKNGKDLQDTIGNINVDRDGSIAEQLGKYKDYDSDIETLYADVDSLEAKDTDLENDIIDLQVNKINKTDIIDNLNSSSNTKVLSAKQGKVLGDAVTALEAENVKKKAYFFDTVADMKAANLKDGDYACTLGYYSVNDGGTANYKIVSSTDNYKETLNNELYAELIVKNEINIKQFGAKGDNQTDDSVIFNNAISYVLNHDLKLYIDKSTYLINNMLVITGSNVNIYCDGTLRTTNNSTMISIEGSLHNIYIHKLQSSNRGGIGLFSKGSLTFTNIIIDNIDDFNKGISLDTSTSPNGGIYYNYIKSNQIIANKCIYLNANNKYINQNYFYMGGLMGNTGIVSEQIVESQGEYNGNCFYNCGFENLQTCIDINNFTHNTFKDFRLYESITGPIFINLHNCDRNLFESNITSALLQNQNISDDISTRRRANIFNCFVTQYGSTTSQYCNKLLSYNHTFEVIENIDLPTRYAFGNTEVHISNLNSLNAYNEFSVYNSENDTILYLDEKYNYDNLYSNLKLYISFIGGTKTIKVYDSNNNLIFDLDNYRSQVIAGKTALFKFELYNGKLYPFLVFKTQ